MSQRNDGDFKLAERLALRPAEVAEVLGVSERHIRQLLPQLPHVRLGGCVVVPVEGLREWLRDRAKQELGRVDSVVEDALARIKG